MSTYCNIKKEFCSKNSTQAILQSNNTSLIISLMFISPWIALVLFKPFHVVLKCIFSMQHIFWRQSSAKEFLSQMVLEMLEKNPNIFFQWPKFFHVCWKNVIDFEHSWFRCMGMWAHYMAVSAFSQGPLGPGSLWESSAWDHDKIRMNEPARNKLVSQPLEF